jgi:hypothetical protein
MSYFSLYPFYFFLCKIGEQEGRTDPAGRRRTGNHRRGGVAGKRNSRVNMVQKMFTHVSKYKNDNC